MKFDMYELKARIAPAFFSVIIPIIVFNHFYISEEFTEFIGGVFAVNLIANLTISTICLFYLSEVGRFIGKNLFERIYFKEETRMPTTSFLMFEDNTYSREYKNRIRNKILTDFNVYLPTEEEEKRAEALSRKKIVETMALIRKKLFGNNFLSQHNIEYGSMRNVIGGAVLGAIFSIINIVIFKFYINVPLAVYISLITLGIYLLLIIFSKVIIDFYGKNYAKVLYREYMG